MEKLENIEVRNLKAEFAENSDCKFENFPQIGLNRTFCKNIKVDPFHETLKEYNSYKFPEDKIDANTVESILTRNMENLNKYKNEGCTVIFDESKEVQTNYTINFQSLLNVLAMDESAFENFIEEEKGKWVDQLDVGSNIDENNCQFESRFESGNLRMAIKISQTEYDLILKNDINSGKSYQWFFFQVKFILDKLEISENSAQRIKFNIINCQKNDMLYSKGLRVLKYSEDTKKWSRDTKDIFYFVNGLTIDEKKFYTLTFSVDLENKGVNSNSVLTQYFSYCYPYTFSDLERYLGRIANYPKIDSIMRKESIGKSQSGNNLDMLIVTNFESDFDQIACRQAVILTSRVHPGESNASFVIQGVIDFLIDENNHISKSLRNKYVFKIVPMLNPDGVINGNFRCDLLGKDLNRMWSDPRDNTSPTIYYTKEMIKKTLQSRDVFLFCDFHGHSNKNNFFLYGCPTSKKNKLNNSKNNFQELILPRLYQKKNDYFDTNSCTNKILQSKLKTARAVVRNEFGIDLSYCLESSIGSITIGENINTFFTPETYLKIGQDFCLCLFDMSNKNIFVEVLSQIQLEEAVKAIALAEKAAKINNLETEDNILNTDKNGKLNVTDKGDKKKVKKIAESSGLSTLNKKKKLKPIKIVKEKKEISSNSNNAIASNMSARINLHKMDLFSPQNQNGKNKKKMNTITPLSNPPSLPISTQRILSDSNIESRVRLENIKFKKFNNHTVPPIKKAYTSTSTSSKKIYKLIDTLIPPNFK